MIDDASYWMQAQWGARVETPAALASRLTQSMDVLRRLNPRLDEWDWADAQEMWESEDGEGGISPFAEVKANLVNAIERNAGTEDDGTLDPFNGYWMAIKTRDDISLTVAASQGEKGGYPFTSFTNSAEFQLPPNPDPSLVDFGLMRNIFLAVNEGWQATWGEASPAGIRPYWTGHPVRVAWMSYVSPHFAPLMIPPASAIFERRPNGGLFLAATRGVFEVANAQHLAVAREIAAALQPLNDVPNPNDAPYF